MDWFASFAQRDPKVPNALDAFNFGAHSLDAKAVAASTMRDLAKRSSERLHRALLAAAESLSGDLEVLLQRSQHEDPAVRIEARHMLKDAWRSRGMAVVEELLATRGQWRFAAQEVVAELLAGQEQEARASHFGTSFERTD